MLTFVESNSSRIRYHYLRRILINFEIPPPAEFAKLALRADKNCEKT